MVGVGTGPPNVDDAPKPTSSVRMSRTLGAPLGAVTSAGKSFVESLVVRPTCPRNGNSGRGSTSETRADLPSSLGPAATPDVDSAATTAQPRILVRRTNAATAAMRNCFVTKVTP